MTGGGAVYHDLGNINYTIVARGRQLEQDDFARNARAIVQVLQDMGVNAGFQGRNDILVDGRKVSGSAKCVLNDRTLFHGTLLFDTDLSVLGQALTPDESKILAKGIKSVRSRVANLREFMPQWNVEMFLLELQKRLSNITGAGDFKDVPAEYCEKAEQLANEKYRKWEWNFGSITEYSYSWKSRFACGGVEINFNVVNNRIAGMKINGDFFGDADIAELADKFNGLPPERNAIEAVVTGGNINKYINGIADEEFISLFRL
jgi:lipoate-protein ligase A